MKDDMTELLALADKLEPLQYAVGIPFTYLEFRMVIDSLRYAAGAECRCEIERKAAGHPPYPRFSAGKASALADEIDAARSLHSETEGEGAHSALRIHAVRQLQEVLWNNRAAIAEYLRLVPDEPQRSAATGDALATLVLEYARDLRRNSSGGDDYPWEYAKVIADYLEELVRRANHNRDLVERVYRPTLNVPQTLGTAILETTSNMAAAVEHIARHQEQCDMDGVMVMVSRQALDEVLSGIEAINGITSLLSRPAPQTVSVRGPDCACCEQQPRKDCTVPGCTMKDAEWALPARHTGSLQCLRCGTVDAFGPVSKREAK